MRMHWGAFSDEMPLASYSRSPSVLTFQNAIRSQGVVDESDNPMLAGIRCVPTPQGSSPALKTSRFRWRPGLGNDVDRFRCYAEAGCDIPSCCIMNPAAGASVSVFLQEEVEDDRMMQLYAVCIGFGGKRKQRVISARPRSARSRMSPPTYTYWAPSSISRCRSKMASRTAFSFRPKGVRRYSTRGGFSGNTSRSSTPKACSF